MTARGYIMLALLAALVGCADVPDSCPVGELGDSRDWEYLPEPDGDDALAVWDGPITDLCDPDRVEIYRAPHLEIDYLCNQDAGPYVESSGCFKASTSLPFIGSEERRPWVFAEYDGSDPIQFIIAHELTHWLFWCSDRIDAEGYGGLEHDHPAFDATVEGMRLELGGEESQ